MMSKRPNIPEDQTEATDAENSALSNGEIVPEEPVNDEWYPDSEL